MKKSDFEHAYMLCKTIERLSEAVQTDAVKEEAKRAEQELKALEAKFKAFQETAAMPLELTQIITYRFFWGG